jgi:hypothetical protein
LLLAGLAGVLLPGCGGSGADTPDAQADAETPTEVQRDIELVNGVLDLELVFLALYRGHRGDVRGDAGRLYDTLIEHEAAHVGRLRGAVHDLGGRPVGPGAAQAIAQPPLVLAERIEKTSIAAYVDALPKLSDPELRGMLATIAAAEAAHLGAVHQALGEPAAAGPFVAGERVL